MDKKYMILLVTLVILALALFLADQSKELIRQYRLEVAAGFRPSAAASASVLTEADLAGLPQPVQQYLRYTGVVGREKVRSFKMVAEGEFKTDPKKGWVKAKSQQYNFLDTDKRIYFMELKMGGIPVVGLHVYKDQTATMKIKLAGLLTVADAKGDIMNKSETVTVFNDMCLGAPASLIDKRITWETIDPLTVRAVFDNNGIKISADLYFNEAGQLINFISNDRSMTTSGDKYEQYPWSTPMGEYKDFNGVKLASYGEAHWSLPEGDYCYGKLAIKEVVYNVEAFE